MRMYNDVIYVYYINVLRIFGLIFLWEKLGVCLFKYNGLLYDERYYMNNDSFLFYILKFYVYICI